MNKEELLKILDTLFKQKSIKFVEPTNEMKALLTILHNLDIIEEPQEVGESYSASLVDGKKETWLELLIGMIE